LVHSILRVEQLHSTGGGWQDQMGGCLAGGAKLGWVQSDGARQCQWRTVPLGGELEAELAERLVLIYTGKTRLAKTLLQVKNKFEGNWPGKILGQNSERRLIYTFLLSGSVVELGQSGSGHRGDGQAIGRRGQGGGENVASRFMAPHIPFRFA
jgi:hypothetical protein